MLPPLTPSAPTGAGARAVWEARRAALDAQRPADDLDLLAALIGEIHESASPVPVIVTMLGHALSEASELARCLPTRPLSEVTAAAPDADEWGLLAGLATRPSAACTAVLAVAGVTPPGVVADAHAVAARAQGRRWPITRRLAVVEIVDTILTLLVPVLVVLHVLGPGRWWELVLIPVVFVGPPFAPVTIPLATAVLLGVFVTPAAAAVQLVRAALDLQQSRLNRRRVRANTGVSLTASEYSGHRKRELKPGPQVTRSRVLSGRRARKLRHRTVTGDRTAGT